MTKSLPDGEQETLDASEQDMAKAVANGMFPGLMDRLKLIPVRVKATTDGPLQVMVLNNPVGEVLFMKSQPGDLVIG